MSEQINLCRVCFDELTKPLSTYTPAYGFKCNGFLCGPICKRYYRNMSIEERKATHYEWVRLEAQANQLQLPFGA